MAIWSKEEREEINNAQMHEDELSLLAYKAYNEASKEHPIKEILQKAEYKPLTDYYSYEQIITDVLRYV